MGEGFYIAPSGDVIPVPLTHIDMIIEHPEKFRMTKKEIKETYEKHNEPLGQEGKAREEIMVGLLNQGWIRVRYTPRNDTFTIQVNKLDARKKDHLADFANLAMEGIQGKKFSKHSELKIIDLAGKEIDKISLKDMGADVLYKVAKIVPIEDYLSNQSIVAKVVKKLRR